MSFRQTTAFGYPAIALRSEELEVVAIPTLGMKLSHLRRVGRMLSDDRPVVHSGRSGGDPAAAGSG